MQDKIHLANDLLNEVIERSIKRKSQGIEFNLTEISPLLNNFLYGLQRGKLTIVGGRPSNGKTAFMGEIAYTLAKQGQKVAFISLEMEGIDIAERLTSRAMSIDNRAFYSGTAGEIAHLPENQANLVKTDDIFSRIAITQNIGFTFSELEVVVKKYLTTHEVIIIDYLQMVKGSATAKDVIDEYIKNLRQLAIETNKVIILGSQVNRGGTSKGDKEILPTMSDLKQSGAIEEVADVVMLCHWQYFYTKEPADKNKYLIIVAKNRATGLTGYVPLFYEPEYYRFTKGQR